MDKDDAATALAKVERTQHRLADMAHWPFHRHAMFGLAEALLVIAVAQPTALAFPLATVALALFVVCYLDDRRRHGMFVSGWQAGPTRLVTVALTAFVVVMALFSASVRDDVSAQPLGYLAGLLTFIVCTAASLRWESLYRAGLSTGAAR